MMKVVLVLALLTAIEGSTVVGRAGGEVTLSCKYDIGLQGALSACWGRGPLPASGCGGQLLSTDGQRVKDGSPASGRYRLLGALGAGDVSLTISNLTGADGGRYGCRVEVPGWFNDHKNHFDLRVEDAPQTTSSSWTASPWEMATNATGPVTSSRRLATSSSSGITAEVSSSVSPDLVWVLVWVLVGSGSLVSVVVLVIALSRRRLARSAVAPVAPVAPGSARFWSSSSGLQLHSGESAVENIYQLDEVADGGGYEYLP